MNDGSNPGGESAEETKVATARATQMEADLVMAKLRQALSENLTRQVMMMLNTCIHCGLCAQACHYYCSTKDPALMPAAKLLGLSEILKTYFSPLRARLPFLSRPVLEEHHLAQLFKIAYEDCTLCARCALTCPMGINTGEIMYLARTLLCRIGRPPAGLIGPVDTAIAQGNYVGMSTDDFIETVEWIGEEMADEVLTKDFAIPVDKPGAQVLYMPHPVEIRDWPFLVMYPVKIFEAAAEDYTFSSYDFDVVNYAYYQGSKDKMMQIAQRVLDAREKLNARSIVLAPCGHGYRVIRWEAEKYLGLRHTFPVHTMVTMVERYLQEGRIRLAKDVFEGPITFHDPCNIARRGGVIQAPRTVLKALTSRFVEMEPHGARNFCCGGGGGLGALAEYAQLRARMGKAKADQIRRSGARIVATGCFNCMTQIRALSKIYELDIEVKSIVELVSGSLKL